MFYGCDKTPPGTVDDSSTPPFLVSANLNVSNINVDTDFSVFPLENGRAFRITIYATAETQDKDGENTIAKLHYKIFKPNSNDFFQQGRLTRGAFNNNVLSFSDSISFEAKRIEPGVYHFEFFAEDNTHWKSNAIQIPLLVTRNNSIPRIDSIFTPDSVFIPASDTIDVLFNIAVLDSDGIGDIEQVYFRSLNSSNPDFHFPMFDDGGTTGSGDNIAGDGVFSLHIRNKISAPFYREFRYFVVDKSGAVDSLSKFITFYQR